MGWFSNKGDVQSNPIIKSLALKHSIIKGHVQSAKHAQHKKQLAEKRSREHYISKAFKAYEQEVHPSGETF